MSEETIEQRRDRIPDGRKRIIYERFFRPNLSYTIDEAYAFIEAESPYSFSSVDQINDFQAKVFERFRVMEPGEL